MILLVATQVPALVGFAAQESTLVVSALVVFGNAQMRFELVQNNPLSTENELSC